MNPSGVVQDFRFALRQLVRAPAFALSAVLTLAIGVGANTGIFSLINGYLRPLPVPHADRIVVIAAELPSDETGFRYRFSYPAIADYRTRTTTFSDVMAFDTRIGGLTARGATAQFVYHVVTGNFFTGLQLPPVLGRVLEPGEGEHPGAEPVIVLAHSYWQRRFGGDPAIVGATVRVDGYPARIVGIAPEGFHGLYQGAEIEGYMPLASLRGRSVDAGRLFTDRDIRFLTVVARMQPDATLASAQADVDVVARRLQADYPAAEKSVTARVVPEPLARPLPLRFLSSLMPLIRASMLGLGGLVLLIACMNVANLMLLRATVREREMAVRAALGSGRFRLIRLLLAETFLLACAGTVGGLLLARWATHFFEGSLNLAIELPLHFDFTFDWRVFAYATAAALVASVLMGLVPALRASRTQVAPLLHDGGYGRSASSTRQRLRGLLVVGQVAGSLVLLVVAGLFVRSLHRSQSVDLGFDPEHILTVRLDPRQIGYSPSRTNTFYDELERRVAAIPGVESVASAFSAPMGFIFLSCVTAPADRVIDRDEPDPSVGCNPVTPAYFETMRIPIVRGRGFTDADSETSMQVAIVNETLARRFWPNADPIGKRLDLPRISDVPWQVVGIARDSKYLAVFERPLPHVYLPMKQDPSFLRIVHIRSVATPEMLGPLVQREIRSLDADMPLADLKTMTQIVAGGMGFVLFRVGAVQATAMGLLGLVLAAVGVYGVVSYGAGQRTREMGIRLALGAAPRTVGRLVLAQGSTLVVAGIVAGLVLAATVTRMLARFFVLVSATDVTTFVLVSALLSVIALVACYLPARRAMRVDPMVALRHE
jgi:putative ABC transport system permease protein